MAFAHSHGSDIYYERHGQGPAVLFCHGAGSNAATWWQQIPLFAQHFTCLIYDHRCFGRSDAPADASMTASLLDDVLAILDAEAIEKVSLVAQSLGGVTAVRFALRHPDRVWAFVSCDSPLAIDHPRMQENVKRFLATSEVSRVEDRALAQSFTNSNVELTFLYQQINRFNPAVFGSADRRSALSERLRSLMEPTFLLQTERLREISCPTLFVVGRHDPLVTPAVTREISQYVAESEFVEIDDAGHSPYFEQPETFNSVVLDFLRKHSPSVITL